MEDIDTLLIIIYVANEVQKTDYVFVIQIT